MMEISPRFVIAWFDSGRSATRTPRREFPTGMDIDAAGPRGPACETGLPYPAAGIGRYTVKCRKCDLSMVVRTAGQADDPRSLRVACKRARVRAKER